MHPLHKVCAKCDKVSRASAACAGDLRRSGLPVTVQQSIEAPKDARGAKLRILATRCATLCSLAFPTMRADAPCVSTKED